MAQREFSAFISAVKELHGPEQAQLSAVDLLDELELMDSQPGSTSRHWRAVTIAASARLANRLNPGPLGGGNQKGFARVLQNGYSCHSIARNRLRHRATSRRGNRRGRHPAHGAGLLARS